MHEIFFKNQYFQRERFSSPICKKVKFDSNKNSETPNEKKKPFQVGLKKIVRPDGGRE
jgi:hypothetical protein